MTARIRGRVARRSWRALAVAAGFALVLSGSTVVTDRLPKADATTSAPTIITGGVRLTSNLSYPTPHGPERMDVYQPAASKTHGRFPGIVFVHGGGWSAGDEQEFHQEAITAAQHGYVGFAIDYDLETPRYPREVRDVEAAIRHARVEAGRFELDPRRLAGWGESAGAHLVMQAAVHDRAPLRAVIGWSGPYDLPKFIDDAAPQYAQLALDFLGCRNNTLWCRYRAFQASPALHTGPGEPPVFLVNSAHELVAVDHMNELADNLHAYGNSAETLLLPGTRHGIAYGDDATLPSLQFLDQQLRNPHRSTATRVAPGR